MIDDECQLFNNLSALSNFEPDSTQLMRFDSNVTMESDASYQDRITPSVFSPDTSLSPNVSNNSKNLINYEVYPQEVQQLVAKYNDLSGFHHRLGLLLSDFLRRADAKREYNRALNIFKKLKIKPSLYDDICSELRSSQRSSSASGKGRARYLASKQSRPNSTRAPVSPSFEFSFSSKYQNNEFIFVDTPKK